MANYPECLKCDCTFSSGCLRETANGSPKKRTYTMTNPRGRRGPYITGGKGFEPKTRVLPTKDAKGRE